MGSAIFMLRNHLNPKPVDPTPETIEGFEEYNVVLSGKLDRYDRQGWFWAIVNEGDDKYGCYLQDAIGRVQKTHQGLYAGGACMRCSYEADDDQIAWKDCNDLGLLYK